MHNLNQQVSPTLIVVMGVSGCGKSNVAEMLANNLSFKFIDADEHHSFEAKAMMKSGHPITDAMRVPWINSICSLIKVMSQKNKSVILACSALRKSHRDSLRAIGLPCHFLHLEGDEQLINSRLHKRTSHFFPPKLLASQYAALENPNTEPDVSSIDITPSLADVTRSAYIAACRFIEGNTE